MRDISGSKTTASCGDCQHADDEHAFMLGFAVRVTAGCNAQCPLWAERLKVISPVVNKAA